MCLIIFNNYLAYHVSQQFFKTDVNVSLNLNITILMINYFKLTIVIKAVEFCTYVYYICTKLEG